MKYLVTGGAGFIGSNLVDELIKLGHSVRVLDNFSTGKKENLNPEANFYQVDIRNLEEINPLFKGADGVFHLAALPRVQESIENPKETNDININGTLNILMAAQKNNVKRVVYSASCAVYGDTDILPSHEEIKPNPKSPYGLQKYVGEEYCKLFSLVHGLETVSLRYFNAYGPRMADTGAYFTVISVFLQQKKAGKPLSITGDGTQTRDFVHVSDIAKSNILAMNNEKIGKGEVINIGSGKHYSINHIASLVGGPTISISPRIEPKNTLADIKKVYKLLNWKPEIELEEGIKELL